MNRKEPDSGDDEQERGTVAPHHHFLQRFRPDSDGVFQAEHAREPSSELRGQRLERRVRRSQRGGRVEAARDAKNGYVRVAVGFDLQGQPDVGATNVRPRLVRPPKRRKKSALTIAATSGSGFGPLVRLPGRKRYAERC